MDKAIRREARKIRHLETMLRGLQDHLQIALLSHNNPWMNGTQAAMLYNNQAGGGGDRLNHLRGQRENLENQVAIVGTLLRNALFAIEEQGRNREAEENRRAVMPQSAYFALYQNKTDSENTCSKVAEKFKNENSGVNVYFQDDASSLLVQTGGSGSEGVRQVLLVCECDSQADASAFHAKYPHALRLDDENMPHPLLMGLQDIAKIKARKC